MPEPTVLDYIKAKLIFWKHSDLEITPEEEPEEIGEKPVDAVQPIVAPAQDAQAISSVNLPASPSPIPVFEVVSEESASELLDIEEKPGSFPWRSSLALIFALLGQRFLDPPVRAVELGVLFFVLAAHLAAWGIYNGEWKIAPLKADEHRFPIFWVRRIPLFAGIALAALSILVFKSHLFTPVTLLTWILTLACFIWAFWVPDRWRWSERLRSLFAIRRFDIRITPWVLIVIGGIALAVFFRTYQINQVPPEMFSDHAEKLLDVWDVLHGQTAVFFPRNTGREFFQFYLTAGIIQLLHTGYTFLSLKIGTILMGLLTLPFIYLIGKEVGNRRVAFYALLFAGIAYWPNVISRVALRFTLYPAFAAPAIFYLLRGLRTSNRNDFILSGIALGLGLHGYTSFRIMPFVVLAMIGIYLIHRQAKGARIQALYGLIVTTAISFVVFIPLFRYALDNPDLFVYRTLTRIGTVEQPLPGPAWQILLKNVWNAVTMFFWSDGEVWVHSVPFRPALDQVSAALFFIGFVLILFRYLRQRNWTDLFLIVSIPLLMMPSILSLAFPNENPSLNRTGGAIIPVFVILGIGLDAFLSGLKSRMPRRAGTFTIGAIAVLLVFWSSVQNYNLVFQEYYQQFRISAWNTSEIGHVIRSFADSIGSPDSAWVIPYPYWVDTRLVGMNAGYPTKDYAISLEDLANTVSVQGAKLFILNVEDKKSLDALKSMYQQGSLRRYPSQVPTKDFLEYLVPPAPGTGQ